MWLLVEDDGKLAAVLRKGLLPQVRIEEVS